MASPRIVAFGGINMDLVTLVERFPAPGVVGRRHDDACSGSSASRSPSPTKLTHNTVMTIAKPGASSMNG